MKILKNSGIEWVGDMPSEWSKNKIFRVFKIIGSGTTPKSDDDDLFVGNINWIQSGDINDGYITQSKHQIGEEVLKKYSALKIYNHPYLVIAMYGASVGNIGVSLIDGCVNQACCVLSEPSENFNFMLYALKSAKNYLLQSARGGGQPNISKDILCQLWIPIPTIEEQQKIADFLDQKCGEIDTVIAKTKATIEEYKKLKQSIITEAVTKGVCGDRPMKDSGIEWVGNVPNNWTVQRVKNIFTLRDERNDLPLEEVNLISLYTDKGVVQHSDIEHTTGNKASNADGYKWVHPNDIVVNIILCWMGAIGRSNYLGVTSPAYDVYAPSPEIHCEYYHYYFRTNGFSGDCYKYGKGIMAMRWRTYSDEFRALRVAVPPISEQKEIADYLDKKCAEMDALIQSKEQVVAELESYKKSVIYEYVTGKKEV